MEIKLLLAALATGFAVGLLFTALKLPLPAPPAMAGVLGIVGIYLGHIAWPYLLKIGPFIQKLFS